VRLQQFGNQQPWRVSSSTKATLQRRRLDETAVFALNQLSKLDRCKVFKVTANDLQTDWQPGLGVVDRCRGRRQTKQGRDAGPDNPVIVGDHIAAISNNRVRCGE
jgi:hypothetical protein